MAGLPHALRVALRDLAAHPGYTLALVLTLGLGIGATTAIFSVVYGVLLRPLPYPEPGRLIIVQGERTFTDGTTWPVNFSAAELGDWIDQTRTFASIGMTGNDSLTMMTGEGLERVTAATVSPDFFATLGLPMQLGRPLVNDRDPVLVLSHRFWRRRFGADPSVVGRSVTFSDRSYAIVGVAPPDLRFPSDRVDVFMPFGHAATLRPERFTNRNRGGFQVIARLRAGASLTQAHDDVERVLAALAPHFVDSRRGMRLWVTPLARYAATTTDMFGNRTSVQPALLMLLSAVGLALLVACANVANLMLARQSSRVRDYAVRLALGAGRGRLIRQSLTETAIVAVLGGVLGLAVAAWAVRLLIWLEPAQLPRLVDVAVDAPVFLFALTVSVVTVAIAGILPAVRTARVDVQDALKAAARTQAGSRRGRRVRSLVIVSEVAVSVVLVVGTLLLGRSLLRLLDTDLGIARENVLTAFVDLSLAGVQAPARQLAIAENIVDRAAALGGVIAAGAGSGLPPTSMYMRQSFTFANPVDGSRDEHMVNVVPVTPGYFEALRIRRLRGRIFTPADGDTAPEVLVLTETAARRFFGDGDPIGQVLPAGFRGRDAPATVVGVVNDVRYTGIDTAPEPVLFKPFAQVPFTMFHVVVRTTSKPTAIASDLRQVIRSAEPRASIVSIRTVDAVIAEAVAQPRFRTVVLVTIAGLATLLAAIGLYGVVAYSVAQRTTEIGVRLALGANARQVSAMVMKEGTALAAAGAALGLALAFAGTRTLESMLYGVEPTDVTSFALAAAALVAIALVASYLPARRAARIDPVVALRAD